jgi:hypothetical protein
MTPDLLSTVAAITGALVPVHQGLVEAYKAVSKIKMRRYFEALAEVMYGAEYTAPPGGGGDLGLGERLFSAARLVPARLGAETRRKWVRGAEARLIESFVQRGVGDSPTPDVSEQDVENVVRVIRERKTEEVRDTARRLRLLAARGAPTGAEAAGILESIPAHGDVKKQLKKWATELRKLTSPSGVGMAIDSYHQYFIEQFLPEEHAARIALPNSLKSAELRYHNDLMRTSTMLAIAEGVIVAQLVQIGSYWENVFAGFAAAAGVFLAAQGSKGLLDAIVGLGARLRQS